LKAFKNTNLFLRNLI